MMIEFTASFEHLTAISEAWNCWPRTKNDPKANKAYVFLFPYKNKNISIF